MDYIEHSKKGTTWKNHKYIRIENGRYIYSESKGDGKGGLSYGKGASGDREATLNEIHTLLKNFKLSGKSGGKKGSSSKSSKKEKEEKEKKSSSKEKQEKSSSAKSSGGSLKEQTEKLQTAANEGEKKLLDVDERFNKYLEKHKKNKDDDKNLRQIREKQAELEKKKKLRHDDISFDGIINKPDIDDLFIEHFGVKGMKWGVRKAIDNVKTMIRKRQNSKTMSNVGKLMRAKNTGYTKALFGVHGERGQNRWRYNSKVRNAFKTALKNPGLEGREVFNKVIRSEHKKMKVKAFAANSARATGWYAKQQLLWSLWT